MRRTKIVCTIGPSSESREKVQALLAAGMDVARLNFSHGTHEEHGRRIKILKEEAAQAGKHLGILLDTKGPEVKKALLWKMDLNLFWIRILTTLAINNGLELPILSCGKRLTQAAIFSSMMVNSI